MTGTAGGDDTDVPVFPDRLLSRLYGAPLATLCRRDGLVPADTVPRLNTLRSRQTGLLAAVNRRFARRAAPAALVISVAGEVPESLARIGFDTVADIVIAITTAAWFGRSCVLYLPAGWSAQAATAAMLIDQMVADLRVPVPVTMVDTADPAIKDRFHAATAYHRDHLESMSRTWPPRDRDDIYRSVRYLPEVVGDIIGGTIRHVIVAGPLHHARAAAAAHRLASSRGHWVDILGHVPTPDLTGTHLMHATSGESVPRIGDAGDLLAGTPATVRHYWSAVWDTHSAALARRRGSGLAAYYRELPDRVAPARTGSSVSV